MTTTRSKRPAAGADEVEVLGVRISHPQKVLWPGEGITKLELAQYYARMAPVLLKYVAQRPLTLRPFPRGVDQPGFYLKNAPKGAPPWLEIFEDVAESTQETVHFVVAKDARTLVWVAQYNAIELHAWLSRIDKPDVPDWAVLDLDPPDEGPWERVAHSARVIHERLERVGLRSFVKLSGQHGIHVLVPLARAHGYDAVREFFQALSTALCDDYPDLLTTDYGTAQRGHRVLIDYAQNARGKTTVAPYSVRPAPGAPVAAPVTWEELDDPALRPNRWTMRELPERLERVGDLLAPALRLHQRLPLGKR